MFKAKFRVIGLLLLIVLLALPGLAAAQGPTFPEVIPLPNGFQPEGVVAGRGTILYAGSLATGAIYQADARTGQGRVIIQPPAGRVAAGLAFDRRTGYLFVAGGPTGQGYVYNTRNNSEVAVFTLGSAPSFINDVIVTRDAAYFTNSSQPVLYRVPLGPGGSVSPSSTVDTLTLGGDFVFVPGAFNANGIVATHNGRWLIIVNTSTGSLYRVDPATGDATLIDLGGASVPSGDGLLLQGSTLYVVQNFLNQIAVVRLNEPLTAGTVVNTLTDPDFDIPTTVTGIGEALYAVNARFSTPPTPDTEYWITRLPAR
jgi:sugar lactone lactonase YvrE